MLGMPTDSSKFSHSRDLEHCPPKLSCREFCVIWRPDSCYCGSRGDMQYHHSGNHYAASDAPPVSSCWTECINCQDVKLLRRGSCGHRFHPNDHNIKHPQFTPVFAENDLAGFTYCSQPETAHGLLLPLPRCYCSRFSHYPIDLN